METDYREILRDMERLQEKVMELYRTVNLDSLKKRLSDLEKESCSDEFWKERDRVATVNQEMSRLKKKIEPWDLLLGRINESKDLFVMALDENDGEMLAELSRKVPDYTREFERLETIELLSGEDDNRPAFLTIHPGAGGTESQDWASMLVRMYLRWAEDHECTVDVIDYTPGDEAGIKSATVLIACDYAYGLLKSERGIHRLVRISPFDANKRRHTSFASVEVIPEVPEDIDVDIKETDLRIDTYRSSGAGGQHVNKTDSAVRITHIPSGIVVQCQNERSQHKNKSSAMKVLRAKLYELKREELETQKQERIGEKKDISWGNQIRSYVYQPYTLVKDHRTGEETGSIDYVFDGDIDRFIYAFLKNIRQKDGGS